MIHSQGAPALTEFRVDRRFTRSTSIPSPAASRLPLPYQGEDGGEGRVKIQKRKNSASHENKFALIRAIPRTGRTHQIRVHLASLGHPVVGDKIYGPNEQLYLEFIETGWTPNLERQLLLPRHALHSSKLAIENGQEWTSSAPAEMFAPFN
jgi:23S rRNA pseudouridine1911/1915/1917 synthase